MSNFNQFDEENDESGCAEGRLSMANLLDKDADKEKTTELDIIEKKIRKEYPSLLNFFNRIKNIR